MLEGVLKVLRQTKVDRVVVVLGGSEREVLKTVRFQKEEVVFNPGYASGMSSSLRAGLAALSDNADAVIVVLADQPFVKAETIDRLIDAYRDSKALVVVPVYRTTRGNPVLLRRALFPRIMAIEGDVGARTVVEENKDAVLEVAVGDEGVVMDLDTPADYRTGIITNRTAEGK
jgi:molybdenum cofactor cytidylyltransferase